MYDFNNDQIQVGEDFEKINAIARRMDELGSVLASGTSKGDEALFLHRMDEAALVAVHVIAEIDQTTVYSHIGKLALSIDRDAVEWLRAAVISAGNAFRETDERSRELSAVFVTSAMDSANQKSAAFAKTTALAMELYFPNAVTNELPAVTHDLGPQTIVH